VIRTVDGRGFAPDVPFCEIAAELTGA